MERRNETENVSTPAPTPCPPPPVSTRLEICRDERDVTVDNINFDKVH